MNSYDELLVCGSRNALINNNSILGRMCQSYFKSLECNF